MATYIVLTILVIISAAYGFGHRGGEGRGEKGGNREGCHGFVVAEEFIRNLSDAQRQALFNITHNRNLTKSELQSQISSWSNGLSGEEKVNFFTI